MSCLNVSTYCGVDALVICPTCYICHVSAKLSMRLTGVLLGASTLIDLRVTVVSISIVVLYHNSKSLLLVLASIDSFVKAEHLSQKLLCRFYRPLALKVPVFHMLTEYFPFIQVI